jgi:PilZ domain
MDLQEIKRKQFRINVKGNSAFALKVNNVSYELIDIGNTGIGIKLTSEDIFFNVDDELPLEIKAENQIFTLKGKVVHINPDGPVDFVCGIRFIDFDQNTQAKWMNFLQSYREKIFNE